MFDVSKCIHVLKLIIVFMFKVVYIRSYLSVKNKYVSHSKMDFYTCSDLIDLSITFFFFFLVLLIYVLMVNVFYVLFLCK